MRQLLDAKLRELRESNDLRLGEIQKTVNEQLHAAVEKQMGESFNRVIDQFTAVQKAMGDVQAVTAQIGDIRAAVQQRQDPRRLGRDPGARHAGRHPAAGGV